MNLNELFETTATTVAVIFGRFNPPHQGHKAAWEMMRKDSSNWFVGTNASTQGPKDPLPYDIKIEAMKAIDPQVEGHLMSSQSWLTMISELHEKFPDAKLIVYTDEEWVIKTIDQYNGVEGKAHGFYEFNSIEHRPTPRISSATQLRDAVAANDKEAFTKAAGIDADTKIAGKAYFDLVAEYLMPHIEKAKAKVAKKKKTKEEIGQFIKQEEAAGVGIVTKQNATRDVPVGGEYMNVRKLFPKNPKKKAKESTMKIGDVVVEKVKNPRSEVKRKEQFRSGSGTHLDRKKASKQGDAKHKKQAVPMEGVAEGSEERSQNRLWAMITDYERRAKATKNNIKKAHYMKMASDLRVKLKTIDEQSAAGTEPGWMLKQDPKLAAKVKAKTDLAKKRRASYGDPSAGKSVDKKSVSEAPIQMDPTDPMDPMIVGTKANPAKLKYRMSRAAAQIKDLASRIDNASPREWQQMAHQFEELKMNIDEIRHALSELAKIKSRGGIKSRGIDRFIKQEGAGNSNSLENKNVEQEIDIILEDLSNFTSAGIPAEFAKNILRKFKIDHDTKIEPIQGKPKNADIEEGNVIINLLPNGDVLALLKRRELPRFSASYNEYYRLELVDGKFKSTRTTKISDATKGMTARGKFFRINSNSIRFFDPYRDKKPTPDEIKDRSTDDPLAGQTIDIYNYMDKVFMPKMRQQMEAMVDDIYANLRKLSKERRWRGDRNQQEQALAAAAAIEKIAKEGFTGNSMEQFLATFGKKHGGLASTLRNESELKKLLKAEPNARAKWAKIILRAARDEHDRVRKMISDPVINALKDQNR